MPPPAIGSSITRATRSQDATYEYGAVRARRCALFLELPFVRFISADLVLLRPGPVRSSRHYITASCLDAGLDLRLRYQRGRFLLGHSSDFRIRRCRDPHRSSWIRGAMRVPGLADGACRCACSTRPAAAQHRTRMEPAGRHCRTGVHLSAAVSKLHRQFSVPFQGTGAGRRYHRCNRPERHCRLLERCGLRAARGQDQKATHLGSSGRRAPRDRRVHCRLRTDSLAGRRRGNSRRRQTDRGNGANELRVA